MDHPFIALFKPLLATGTTDEAVAYLLKHPVLTSSYYTALLEKWAGSRPLPERHAIERMIQLKLATFQDIRGGRLRIDLPNPIIDLATKVTEGKFTLQHAQQIAARPEVFVELMCLPRLPGHLCLLRCYRKTIMGEAVAAWAVTIAMNPVERA